MLENNTWQGGYVDGYGYAALAVTIYGTSWNETGRWDIDGCPPAVTDQDKDGTQIKLPLRTI